MAASSPAFAYQRPATAWPGMCGLFMLAGDLSAVAVSMTIAVLGRYLLNGDFDLSSYWRTAPVLTIFIAAYALNGLYPGIMLSPVREIRLLTLATTIVFIIFTALLFLVKEGPEYSRAAFLVAWVLTVFLVPLTRASLRAALSRRSWWGYPVVIFGACNRAHQIVQGLRRQPNLGLMPVAVFDDHDQPQVTSPDLPVLGRFHDAARYAQQFGLSRALIAVPDLTGERLVEMLDHHSESFSRVYIFPELSGLSSLGIEPRELCNQLSLELRRSLLLLRCQLAKRMMDAILGLILGLCLLPLMLLTALLIRLESPGAALFGHRRIGHLGKEFKVWKFRTMYTDGDRILEDHWQKFPEDRREWRQNHKLRRDPRVTAFGRLLRKTSLDEIPQLWNVLKGEMSLVGPRPIVAAEVPKYGKHFGMYCRVMPGLTGLWQVSGRSQTDYQERVDLDIYYVRNWSPWFDIYLLARTFFVVIKGEGAY